VGKGAQRRAHATTRRTIRQSRRRRRLGPHAVSPRSGGCRKSRTAREFHQTTV